jgi:glycosyltransferase involved in cell wall biosynthesis
LQFPAHDPAALADRVERLIADRALRQRVADAAAAVAATRSWDAIFDRLVQDYWEVLGQPLRIA